MKIDEKTINDKHFVESVRRELARRSFYGFIYYLKPDYIFSNFANSIISEIELFLQEVRKGKRPILILQAPPQHGKALKIDTPILTPDGFKTHGDLKVGDIVFNDKGEQVRVLANSGAYEWDICNIEFQKNISIEASPEHLWKLQVEKDNHKGRYTEIIETQNIFKSKWRRAPAINLTTPLKLNKQDLRIDPYLLGVWLGDGNSRNAYITCGEEFIEELAYLGKVKKRDTCYTILPAGLQKALRAESLLLNKHIPIPYLMASEEQRRELLRGLMDTDGSVSKDGSICEFCQKKNKLVDDVEVLIRSLGYNVSRYESEMKLNGRKLGQNKIRLQFTPNKNDKIFKLKKKQDRINNKTKKDREDKKRYFIKSVTPLPNKTIVNCIEVEGGIYLAGRELIPTHNSELVSRLLPAYLLGKYSKMRIAGASYSQDLATAMNKDIQRYMQSSEYQELFPNSSLGKVNRLNSFNAEKITIFNKRNYYLASSVGGALTGKSVDIGIIDDPIKNMQEARSPATRRTIESWYKAVFLTRLSKRCGQIIMMTRWHEEDLIGTILKNKNLCQNIKVLSYPAINDKQEALVPELHPLSQLEEIRAVMSEYEWQAMYMQHPISDVGNVFKWQDFSIVPSSFISSLHFDYTFITADTAMKTKEMNDYTVYTAWGFDKSSNKLYMLDMYRDKVESIEREEQARIFYNRNAKFPFKAMFIEDKVSGTDLGQRLKNGDKRLNLKPLIIRMIERKADKITRAFEVLPYLSTYSIAINENIKYIEDIKQEINGFPYAPHDDIVDTIIDGLQVAYGKKEGVDYTNLYKGLSMR